MNIFNCIFNKNNNQAATEDNLQARGFIQPGPVDYPYEDLHRKPGIRLGTHKSSKGFGKRKAVTYPGNAPLLVVGPPRAGFTTGIAIPTLFSTNSQFLVAPDVNGELYRMLSRWLKDKDAAIKFAPASEDTVHYNPLAFVRVGSKHELQDITQVAHALLGDVHGGGLFVQMAFTVIVDAIQQTLAEGQRLHDAVPFTDLIAMLDEDMDYPDLGYAKPDITLNAVYRLLHDTPEKLNHLRGRYEENVWSGVIHTAEFCLSLFADPLVAAATADCDGLYSEYRKDIFLVAGSTDVQRLAPLFRVIVEQQLRSAYDSTLLRCKDRLLVLDNLSELGYLPSLQENLAVARDRGLKFLLHTHSVRQIEVVYGTAATNILGNCTTRVYLAPVQIGDDISDMTWRSMGARKDSSVIFEGAEPLAVIDKAPWYRNNVMLMALKPRL